MKMHDEFMGAIRPIIHENPYCLTNQSCEVSDCHERMMTALNYEPGSYRDRDGRVFYDASGGIYRTLSERALAEWQAVHQTQFFQSALETHQVISSKKLTETSCLEGQTEVWAGVISHQAVPFISYPYEWSFSMLRDAALLHLDLLENALGEDITLKDGTAYNVQWLGVRPVFIDVVSFERLTPGKPWAGYRQFCQTFLFPLMLQAYKNVAFHPWLRGALEGITPQDCWNLMSFRDIFRRGVLTHVWLHALLQSRRAVDEIDTSKALQTAGFGKELILANVVGLKKLLRRFRWSPRESSWSEYTDANGYTEQDRLLKEDFVRRVVHSRHLKLVWDIGCNTGAYSRIAAENADLVIAMDSDHLAIERLYLALKANPPPNSGAILPIVNNVVDPSGGLGWRCSERKPLTERGRPQLTLCLALVHHLVIGHGVPLLDLLTWFAELGTSLVIEFISKEDPMVQRLLRGREDNYSDYDQECFERLLGQMFRIVRSEALESGTRILYFAETRSV